MRYLFGDSTESALEINYLAFVRDAIEFAVVVMQSDVGLASGRERRAARERAATEAQRDVEAFGRTAAQMAEPIAKLGTETPVGRAAGAVASAAAEAVRREVAQVQSALGADVELIDAEAQKLRARCVTALAALLATHDLPAASETITVRWNGTSYDAELAQSTEIGIEVALALEIAATSPFAQQLRVDKIAEHVDVHAPETAGWLKKEVKYVQHKLARLHLTELTVDDEIVVMRLREGATGYDIAITHEGGVGIERVDGDGATPFETDDRDPPALKLLAGRLEEAARALREHRQRVVSATIDEVQLAQHAQPRVLVERLVAAMAPVVKEISAKSLAPGELVLKRLLAGDRREELFVAKSELAAKLEPLPPAARKVFAPLGIVEDERPERPGKKTMPPPPPPPPRVTAEQSAAAVDDALRELEKS